ncbi:Bug family tripartite tricarboxylate transporter substrate binding protein [Verminephrobacter eiseniae]|uniref:Bug family tripartite tricarboxylate transporter substrate binding protein n=1 Tax=Verminephrobacter eiseniae TaxID=364317 RepID=UPI0022387125|nr:tripartite tricarboxylate transporter substrate binding protein [Verminephrobacter eiseniae]MCW5230979.1 tripartite tricarboxylate transporter substrate binding protein [Verminephrobacter eiseniae]MCW5292712.1 tripartite tricarboxylate transporter substrate binding protein [Verminephrobacter eiseniae]MCW8187325.1 tripartite tricarboxylate transporter substrate binding protein [Verminephrobacter eiseniae]MCW8225690.1 tripartite tricarboxylate transporter substrate binding protein [Verminephro
MDMKRRALATGVAALLTCAATMPAMAQGYPSKPIRFVVGFSAGNSIDSVARIIGQHLSTKLGQPVVVENKTGANGMLAATEVARSQPDGYTVLISNSSTITVNPLLYKKMSYDAKKDFAPVSLMVSVPFILTVNPQKAPIGTVSTLQGMLDLAKAKSGAYSYGSAGMGNLTQLSFELLNGMAGASMTHVAYRGSAPAQVALLGGEVDAAFDNPSAVPKIKAGQLRALAVTSAQRWHELPDVPAIAESGYPGFDISFWVGALVPAQTPVSIVNALSEAIATAVQDPAVKARLEQQGNIRMFGPKRFAEQIDKETAQYAEIIRKADIKLD